MRCPICGRPGIVLDEKERDCKWCERLSPGARVLCRSLSTAHRGRSRAVKIEDLFRILAIQLPAGTTVEKFRILKEELIEKGHPICSGPWGWYYPATLEDATAGARIFEDLAADHALKAKRIRDGGLELFGPQLALPGVSR
jgi:hypothetical protein